MAIAYEQLLAATIAHLEGLKSEGVKYLIVDRDLLAQLGRPQELPREHKQLSTGRAMTQPTPMLSQVPAPGAVSSKVQESAGATEMLIENSTVLSREQKELEMARIRERALACVKCPNLASSRRNVVFGVGTIHTELVFVGEAPGMDEDQQGEPFVGRAGQLLTKIIQTMGLDRDKVYIANVLKCRPDTPGQRTGNRKPTLDEMNTCKPYLLAQIGVIRPKVIVALGATAIEGLLGKSFGIMKLRGNWQDFNGVPLMPTYHPAYLLRNQSLTEKRKVWEDMLSVMEKLNLPISEKQRGFFLGK